MWTLSTPNPPPDITRLQQALAANAELFDADTPLHAARAPGRLDLMGGIADYSGSLVLELPLAVATYVAAQPCAVREIVVRSLSDDATEGQATVRIALDDIAPGGAPMPYDAARAFFARAPEQHWAAYPVGTILTLMHERGLALTGGLHILIVSEVPTGKGVSSSAAIEVATMRAVCALSGIEIDGRALAILCQKAENLVVGAPCGVMDQMTSACGLQDALLALHCQPAELQPAVQIPAALAVWGIDSGVRHAVSGADYGSVRVGAFMGARIVADVLGLNVRPAGPGLVRIDDPLRGGYLANLSPVEWEEQLRSHVPEHMTGADFLARYHGITDTVTRVDPARTYAVRQPTAHPIFENHRVHLFRELLQAPLTALSKARLGEQMYMSHASYSACGLGSDATDQIVHLARAAGPAAGIYGAKITGGGSGGTVAILAERDSAHAVRALAAEYAALANRGGVILSGSSHGAAHTGALIFSA